MGHTAGLHKIDFLLHIKNSKKKKKEDIYGVPKGTWYCKNMKLYFNVFVFDHKRFAFS